MIRSSDDIKEIVETSSSSERIKMIDSLYKKWIVKSNNKYDLFDYLGIALKNFNLDIKTVQLGSFEKEKNKALLEITMLQMYFEKDNINKEDKEFRQTYIEKFTKIYKSILDAESAIGSSLFLSSSMTLSDIGKDTKTRLEYFRHTPIEFEKMTPYQSLLIYLEEKLKRREYRRYLVEDKCICYEKICNEEGYDTHAWKPAMPIEKFIHTVTDKNYNFAMWQNLLQDKSNLKGAAKYLAEYTGPEFEDLTKDRNVFSFNNGIYITKVWDEEIEGWTDKWIPFKGEKSEKIGASVVSSKLFDLDFNDSEYEDWFEIIEKNCPNFISIMKYQKWPDEVQRWFCIFTGRMFYKIGELDNWQVIIFLIGQAGTGKSTLLDCIISQFYETEDVGVLGNNGQKTFGLSALVGKKIFIGPEIKKNLALEQSEFQSMVTGEKVSVNEKYKTAYSMIFDVPGMLAGNEMPEYSDNSGSIARRVVGYPFNYKVLKGDTKLGQKLKKELAHIMRACNKGYLEMVNEHGKTSGIWNILPVFFKKTQAELTENTNSLAHFLGSDLVILGENLFCREKVFITEFNDHCRESHFIPSKWTNHFYAGTFTDFGIKVERNCRKRYPNLAGEPSYTGTWIIGVDIKEKTGEISDDE
jgi:hypothetical protein